MSVSIKKLGETILNGEDKCYILVIFHNNFSTNFYIRKDLYDRTSDLLSECFQKKYENKLYKTFRGFDNNIPKVVSLYREKLRVADRNLLF
jgi:Zn-dependent M32 family carboxypeptidase